MAACSGSLSQGLACRRQYEATPLTVYRGACRARALIFGESARGRRSATFLAAGKQGGGVLDRPSPITAPGQDIKKVRQKQKPRQYKVMLHNDSVNRREYVVRVLLKVIKELTVDDAVGAMQQAHMYGMACVIACPQQDAEKYCEGLRANGLIATIEPAGPSSGGSGDPTT